MSEFPKKDVTDLIQTIQNYKSQHIRNLDEKLKIKIVKSLEDALNFLQQMPEDHVIWKTPYWCNKITTCCKEIVRTKPNDLVSRWNLIVCDLIVFGYFETEVYEYLIEQNIQELQWLVAAALWIRLNYGVITFPSLEKCLIKLKLKISNFDEKIHELNQNTDTYLSTMSQIATIIISEFVPMDTLLLATNSAHQAILSALDLSKAKNYLENWLYLVFDEEGKIFKENFLRLSLEQIVYQLKNEIKFKNGIKKRLVWGLYLGNILFLDPNISEK